MLEKALESPLDCKEIQPVHLKGHQSWVFIGRTDFEAEIPILRPYDVKNWLILKDPNTGKDWGQEEKGMTEDEMVGWHHRLNGHGFGCTPGGLVGWGSWGCKESDTTERLNWTELNKNWWMIWGYEEALSRPKYLFFSMSFWWCRYRVYLCPLAQSLSLASVLHGNPN